MVAERAWREMQTRREQPGLALPLLAAAGALVVVAVASSGPFVGAEPTHSAAASIASGAPSDEPTPGSTPTLMPSEREVSDRFWSRAINYAPSAFGYRTLEETVAGSELIVRGRIVGHEIVDGGDAGVDGDETGQTAYAVIAIDATLKADPLQTTPTVLVRMPLLKTIPEDEVPGGELVLFLKNYGRFYVSEGYPTPTDSPRWSRYFLANTYQGVIRNLDGKVDVLEAPDGWWDQYGPFPNDFNGKAFQTLIEQIEAIEGA
jgi:hypothetical protein